MYFHKDVGNEFGAIQCIQFHTHELKCYFHGFSMDFIESAILKQSLDRLLFFLSKAAKIVHNIT